MLGVPLLYGQSEFLPGGGGESAGGSVYITFGQALCLYPTDAAGIYNGQGVQQPYCTPRYDTVVANTCARQRFRLDDFSLPPDSTATLGRHLYNRYYFAFDGCDSTITLVLNVHGADSSSQEVVACDTYTWNDNTFTASAIYDYRDTTSFGCDSVVTLLLTVNYSSDTHLSAQAAIEYRWHGTDYYSSGTYSDTLFAGNSVGCDSIVVLRLALLQNAPLPVIFCFSQRLIMVDHYPWGEDSTRVDYRTYRWYHDGVAVSVAGTDNYCVYDAGAYRKLEGCYYVEVPADRDQLYWVRSNQICFPINESRTRPVLAVFPNPSSDAGVSTIIRDAPQGSLLSVYDQNGRKVYSAAAVDGTARLPIALPRGVYTFSLSVPDGERITLKHIAR